ncbi:uncharacterized protein V6R79_005078 [Siganus canaliculatus]
MDGVLEGAALLCVCKLALSFLFLPSLTASNSPVSFCCCCLLLFTDFLVTVFLSALWVCESWLTALIPLADVIALRFLLFLSHTYGSVLLLTTPLIAVETLTRLLRPPSIAAGTRSDVQCRHAAEEEEDEEEDESDSPDRESSLYHVVSYLCCLSVWVVIAVNVRWQWKLEEVWAAACLHTSNSLLTCLPNLLSPASSPVSPCWIMAFLIVILLLLTTTTGLHRPHAAPFEQEAGMQRDKHGVKSQGDSSSVSALSMPINAGMMSPAAAAAAAAARCVDPEKTESSCTVHKAYSWNIMQMSARHQGDFVLFSSEFLSEGRGHESTETGIPLTFITEDHMDSHGRSSWRRRGFPCLGVNVITGCVSVLAIFVLPLNLSVNILLIRTIDSLLEAGVQALVGSAAESRSSPTPSAVA